MASITTRQAKGAPLTNAELDANFVGLNGELALVSGAPLAWRVVMLAIACAH